MNTLLQEQIRNLTRAHRGKARALTALRAAWVFLATALLLAYIDVAFQLPDLARLILDFGVLVAIIAVIVVSFRALTRAVSAEKMVARLVEERHPELHNDIVNSLQFAEELQRDQPRPVSKELMAQEISLAAEKLKRVKGFEALRPPTLKKEGLVLIGLGAAVVVCVIFLGAITSAVVPRFIDPFGDHPPYNPTALTVTPNGGSIDYGEDLKIEARADGPKPANVALVLTDGNGKKISALPMFEGSAAHFFQTVQNVQDDLFYHVEIPRGRSKRQKVGVTKWPRIQTTMVTYEYPAYTKLPPQTRLLKEVTLKGYKGTKATLTLLSNRPLKGGALKFGAKEVPFAVTGSNTVSATIPLLEKGAFSGSIVDTAGAATRDKLEGQIEIEPDLKPEVTIVSPGMDSFATSDAKVSINIEAKDDLEVTRVELYQGFGGKDLAKQTLKIDPGTMVNTIHEIDLAKLKAQPGDIIEYYASASDSSPDGPQSAATQPFKLAVISHEQYRELMQMEMTAEDLAQKYDDLMRQLEQLASAQEKLQKETAELEAKKATGASSPELENQLKQLQQEQESLTAKTRDFAEQLRKEAKGADVFDIEKDYKKLLEQFASTLDKAGNEMQQGAEQMQEGANKSDGQNLKQALGHQQQAMNDLRQTTDEFKKSIQQANEDLARIGKLMEDVEEFKELLGRQEAVETQARQYRQMQNPAFDDVIRMKELGEEEQQIQNQLEQLAKNLNEHAEEVQKDYPKVADDARNIAGQISEKKIAQSMKDAADKFGSANGVAGHPPALEAFEQMKSLVSQCNSSGNSASGQCEARLRISMNMNPGDTLKQMAKRFGRGNGRGQGNGTGMGIGGIGVAGAGSSGSSGAKPIGMFGPDGAKQRPRSSGGGRSDKKAESIGGPPEQVATSFEEITGTTKSPLEAPGAAGERVMQEYRTLIEAYFRKLAEEK